MQKILPKQLIQSKLTQGILSTLAFFDIYKRPLSAIEVHKYLYGVMATRDEVVAHLQELQKYGLVVTDGSLYALEMWNAANHQTRQQELEKRWLKIKKNMWLLSLVPFVKFVAVINSVAMGAANQDSDIDFFVITQRRRLYFVRTFIILLFRLLGLYKSAGHVQMRFCFGFYVDQDHLNLQGLTLRPSDPYFNFWLASMRPIIHPSYYPKLIKENKWIYHWLPNFNAELNVAEGSGLVHKAWANKIVQAICYLPAVLLEPLLRYVHIRHTNKRPENHWKTSTTVARPGILKLHALDVRQEIRYMHQQKLAGFGLLPKNN